VTADLVRRRLLFPATCVAGNSLIGLLSDAAHDNHHGTVAHLLAAAGYPHHAHFDLSLSRLDLLPALAEVLRIPAETVRELSYPALDSSVGWGAERVDFHGAPVWAYDLDFRRRRVAPASLRVSPHHRALWTHALIPWCPETGDALLDSCPACGAGLRWHRAAGVTACDRCEADLRAFPAPGPSDDVRYLAEPVIDLLVPGQERHGPALSRLHDDVREIGRGAAFELGWRLACALGAPAGEVPRLRHHKQTAETLSETLAEAGRILSGWPHAIEERLSSIGTERGSAALTEAVARLRRDMHRRRTWPEIAALVERTMPDVFGRRGIKARSVAIALSPGVVNGTAAAKLLGLGSRKFAALHRADLVDAVHASGTTNRFMSIDAATLEASRRNLEDRIPRGAVKTRLGVTAGGVEQLVCLGELRQIDDPLVLHAHPGVQIGRASLDQLVARIEAAALGDDPARDVRVSDAMRGLGGREKPYGPVIAAMAEGRIQFTLGEGGDALLKRTRISGRDAARLRDFGFDRADHAAFPFDTTITRQDAADVLNAAPTLMMEILDDELAHAGAGGHLLDRDAVLSLAARRISGREVLIRWASGGRRLPRPLRECGLERLGPAGWDRKTVEALLA
jgi:hypothetical protein